MPPKEGKFDFAQEGTSGVRLLGFFPLPAVCPEQATWPLWKDRDHHGSTSSVIVLIRKDTPWEMISVESGTGNVLKLLDSIIAIAIFNMGLPRWLSGKEAAYNEGEVGLIPGSGWPPRKGNGNPLQYFLGNPMDRGDWRAVVRGVAKESNMT